MRHSLPTSGTGTALFFTILLILATAFLPLTSHAQSILPASQMGYARVGKYMYVQGGFIQTTPVNRTLTGQVYSLDLSTSWSVDSPPWKQLYSETPSFLPKLVALPNNQTIYSYGLNYSAQYDITSNTWTNLNPGNPPEPWVFGFVPIIDPNSGSIYLAGFYYMNVYNPQYNSWSNVSMIPPTLFPERYFPQGGYNRARKSIMYFGGFYNLTTWCTTSSVTEYTIDTKQWTTLMPGGQVPGPRADHCLAFSEDGNTLILWGGRVPIAPGNTVAQQNQPTAEIYLLNIASNSWTKGQDAPSAVIYPSCAVVGNLLVTWGGENTNNIISGVMVFNLTSLLWVSNYTPPAYYVASSNSTTPTQPSPTPSPTNIGAIVGGSVGGVIVLAILGFILYKRRNGYDVVGKPAPVSAVIAGPPGGGRTGGGGQPYSDAGLSGNIRPNYYQEPVPVVYEKPFDPNYQQYSQFKGQVQRAPQGEQPAGWNNGDWVQGPRNPQGQYEIHHGP
ncbi:hypothetical protein BGX26_002163 [Mortierella sp. AD094]|nr:hypothetical protein BGX26_002163 [Mortierella sp. AD094]